MGSSQHYSHRTMDFTENPSSQFIHAIRTAPDPAIVLSSDYQINDMVRFCKLQSIPTVDPTFSLGDFDVTPMDISTDKAK